MTDYSRNISLTIQNKQERDAVLEANDANGQAARTFVSLITNVAKDQNVRYVLTLLDDMLQVGHISLFLSEFQPLKAFSV